MATKSYFIIAMLLLAAVGVSSSSLCEECSCTKTVVDCRKSQLILKENTTIGDDILEGYFSGLAIESIGPVTFTCGNCSMELLDLSANYIATVPGNTFRLLNTVTRLKLRNNNIFELKNNSFKDLLDLTILDLGFNKIEHLPSDLLNELINLSDLDLKYNEIAHIPDSFFFSSRNLKRLDISHLRLESLSSDVFMWKLCIEYLDISHNLFKVVPTEALKHLGDTLRTLKMSGNRIKTLSSGSFNGLRSVNFIQMEQLLQLQTIQAYAFSGMESLENIELRYLPHIVSIDGKAFNLEESSKNVTSNICPLYDFTLCFSTLSYLPQELLNWENVRQVMLRNNQWDCNCNMKWVKGSAVEEKSGAAMYCSFPSEIRGANILTLQKEDFSCERPAETKSNAGIGLLLFVFIVGFIVSTATVTILVYRRNGWLIRRPRGFNLLDNETITVYDRSDLPTISKPYQSTVISNP